MTTNERPCVMTIGTFDGLHIGHQALLETVQQIAQDAGWRSLAYTFGVPPRVSRDNAVERVLLLPWRVREAWMKEYVDRVECATFSRVRDMTPDDFVTSLASSWNARAVVVGEGFRFGADRRGDTDLLRRLADRNGIQVSVISPVHVDGAPVSSTRVRSLLSEGRVVEATACLGHPPMLYGPVVHGDRIGRTLGFPTANLRIGRRVLLPRDGVYRVAARWHRLPIPGRLSEEDSAVADLGVPGALYIGRRPSISGQSDLRCEVHLLDPPGAPLVGCSMEIALLDMIREEMRFSSRDELKAQIAADVETARRETTGNAGTVDPFAS